MGVLKITALCTFLSVFLAAAYFGSKGTMKIEPSSIVSAIAFLMLRMAMIARSAKAAADPKLASTNAALQRSAVVVIGLFLGVFACFIPGLFIVGALKYVAPDVAPDDGLVAVLSTMPEAELHEIAGNPYVD